MGAVGYFVGAHFGYPAAGAFLGGTLGFVIAIRETIRIVRMLSRDSDSD